MVSVSTVTEDWRRHSHQTLLLFDWRLTMKAGDILKEGGGASLLQLPSFPILKSHIIDHILYISFLCSISLNVPRKAPKNRKNITLKIIFGRMVKYLSNWSKWYIPISVSKWWLLGAPLKIVKGASTIYWLQILALNNIFPNIFLVLNDIFPNIY